MVPFGLEKLRKDVYKVNCVRQAVLTQQRAKSRLLCPTAAEPEASTWGANTSLVTALTLKPPSEIGNVAGFISLLLTAFSHAAHFNIDVFIMVIFRYTWQMCRLENALISLLSVSESSPHVLSLSFKPPEPDQVWSLLVSGLTSR